ncbi:MAG: hypothetical protein NUW37_15390 [Planctomycetes bacterium]|nr:hypothetical protein [Planctomycetota bacterium]
MNLELLLFEFLARGGPPVAPPDFDEIAWKETEGGPMDQALYYLFPLLLLALGIIIGFLYYERVYRSRKIQQAKVKSKLDTYFRAHSMTEKEQKIVIDAIMHHELSNPLSVFVKRSLISNFKETLSDDRKAIAGDLERRLFT